MDLPHPPEETSLRENPVPGRPGVRLEIRHASLKPRTGQAPVEDISMFLQPGELVVLTGPDRRPVSTLLRIMAGVETLKKDTVLLDGVDLAGRTAVFRHVLAYVPPGRTVPLEDTVQEALSAAASLALPRHIPAAERQRLLSSVIGRLGLQPFLSQRISSLPGNIERVVQIAVEAVRSPDLLLVDEPVEGLDAYSDLKTAHMLKDLAAMGLTVALVSRTPAVIGMADKTAIITPSGNLAWFGPPAEALEYFRSAGLARQDSRSVPAWEEILSAVEVSSSSGGQDWSKRFQAQPAFQQYSMNPLSAERPDLLLQDQPLNRLRGMHEETKPPEESPLSSPLAQVFPLAGRTVRTITRTRLIWLALLAPVLAGAADLLASSRTMFDPQTGDPFRVGAALGLLALFAMLAPAFLFSQVLWPEKRVVSRERRLFLNMPAYTFAKIIVLVLFGLYQSIILTVFHFLAAGLASGLQGLLALFASLFLISLVGGLTGLLAGGLAASPAAAAGLALALVLPQMIIGGVLAPLPAANTSLRGASLLMPARYGFESLITASQFGESLAADTCWNLPTDQRLALSDAQKQACGCMGANIFSACNFPGVHAAFSPILEQPEPALPIQRNSLIPVQPSVRQGQSLDEYAQEVNAYTLALEIYQGGVDGFVSNLRKYAADISAWQRDRSLAVGRAEGALSQAYDRFSPFIGVSLLADWVVLAGFCLLLTIILIVVLVRKRVD